ncbi:DUF2375 family protein [Agarivorans gilvus]|uniref:DUF2375 domain-containing protein n=1 Tax=Agarivorans gilvus TaxID=680279 RepID=A0ABQ1I130_9ALTE|nr:DUF2375 family protein [Agarivorans gilvus]GGB04869.1 hypothetical protein GCM10007414_17680 [Agarivorans gilvus]
MKAKSQAADDVTVLYYSLDNPLQLRSMLVKKQFRNQHGRVVLSPQLKHDKIIVALIDGEAKLLNLLGERCQLTPLSAA